MNILSLRGIPIGLTAAAVMGGFLLIACPGATPETPLNYDGYIPPPPSDSSVLPPTDSGVPVDDTNPSGKFSGCFENFESGGAPVTVSNAEYFEIQTTLAKEWKFAWDGLPRGRHNKNQLVYLADQKKQRIIADGSSLVIYREYSPYKLPAEGILELRLTQAFDTIFSGTPASQSCTDSDAGWIEILMTNDVNSVIRAIVWKNDGSKNGHYVLSEVCPLSNPDQPNPKSCYIGIKVGAHQDGKNVDDKYPCAMGNFILKTDIDALCLK